MKTQTRAMNQTKRAAKRNGTVQTKDVKPQTRGVDIYVLAKGEWKFRKTVVIDTPTGDDTKDANKALKTYGIHGTRPRLGEATSKSGRRFCAVPAVTA